MITGRTQTWLAKALPMVVVWLAAGKGHTPTAIQAVGVCSVVAGIFLLWGLAITLLVGGVLAVGLGVLFEKVTG